MIPFPLLILVVANFIAIGLLPILFFRRDGEFNLRWLATGAPFFVAPLVLVLGSLGIVDMPPLYSGAKLFVTQAAAVMLCVISIGLIAMTVGTHRIPLALWHQDNDAPAQIVTWGPYKRIRHPFYTSFLFAFMAAVFAMPHPLTLTCLVYAIVALSVTAGREEDRLAQSEFGGEYLRYMAVSGRFFPRIRQ